jgi:hypothetical protein
MRQPNLVEMLMKISLCLCSSMSFTNIIIHRHFHEGLPMTKPSWFFSVLQQSLIFIFAHPFPKSHDNSVSIVLGYGLHDRGSRVRFPVGAGNFSLHHSVQNSSGAQPASYPMGTRGSFSGDKAAGT